MNLHQLCAALKEVERDLAGMKRGNKSMTPEYFQALSYRNRLLKQIKNA